MNVFCWRSAEQCAASHKCSYLGENGSKILYLAEKRSNFINASLYIIEGETLLSTHIKQNLAQESQKYQQSVAKRLKIVFYPVQKHTFWVVVVFL